jgi:hypothetical protein
MSCSDAAIHFGLGQAKQIERIRVRWPDSSSTTYENLPSDAEIVIRRDQKDPQAIPFRADNSTGGTTSQGK